MRETDMGNGYSSERSQLNDELVSKALKDDDFRQRLMSDPRGTIESEYGVSLSPETNVTVHTESPRELHVVLPAAPSAASQLSSDEMDSAACSGWGSFAECTAECTQCGNNGTTCAPGPTGDE
jgi:hypothetical protein